VQGPEIWLKQLGIEVACVVDPQANAVLDEAHRVFVNYEAYYLSSPDAVRTFQREPWRYTGPVTDPVSGERFEPDAASAVVRHEGRLFYFRSTAHAKTFGLDPATYATPVVPYAGRM
jgi:YHS domain-containing protein